MVQSSHKLFVPIAFFLLVLAIFFAKKPSRQTHHTYHPHHIHTINSPPPYLSACRLLPTSVSGRIVGRSALKNHQYHRATVAKTFTTDTR